MPSTGESSPSGLKSMFVGSASPLAIVGAAFFWLWMDEAVFSATLTGLSDTPETYARMFLITTVGTVVFLALLLVGRNYDSPVQSRPRVLSIPFAIAGVLGGALLLVSSTTGSIPLFVLGCVLDAASFAFLTVLWGMVCVAQGHARALVHISAAWALGFPLNLLIAALPPLAAGVVVCTLPAISVSLFQVLCALQEKPAYSIEEIEHETVPVLEGRGLILGVDARLVAIILVFCSVFGLMYVLQASQTSIIDAGPLASWGVVGARGVCALVFLVVSLTVLRDRVQLLFKGCFYILVAGLAVMFMGFFVPQLRAASPILVAVGYCGFDILVWTMVAFHRYATTTPMWRVVCVAMLAEQAGIAAGAALGVASEALALDIAAQTGVMLALNLLALAVLVAYTEYGSRLWTLLVSTSMSTDEAFSTVTRDATVEPDATRGLPELGERYGLTSRELEVLSAFVRGRSMAYIADKMIISKNTVKTHLLHIYAKCDVHSKQELIDLAQEYGVVG